MDQLNALVKNLEFEALSGTYNGHRQFYTCFKDTQSEQWHCTDRVFHSFYEKNHLGSFGKEDVNICKHIPSPLRKVVLSYKYPNHVFHEYEEVGKWMVN